MSALTLEGRPRSGPAPHVAGGNVHVPEQVLGGGGIRELDQQGIRAVTAQIPSNRCHWGWRALVLAGAGRKPIRGRPGWARRSALLPGLAPATGCQGDGVGRIARYAEQLQGLVGVVALTVRSLRTREDEIPMAIVEAAFHGPVPRRR